MMASLAPYPFFAKEVRAALPIAAASLAGMALSAIPGDFQTRTAGLFIYATGAVVLGSHAVGHEFSSRTLPFLLSQPVERWRLLLVKQLVLAAMLAVLALGALALASRDPLSWSWSPPIWSRGSTILAIAVMALGLPPALTIICRGQLAAAVFCVAVIVGLRLAGDILGGTLRSAADLDEFTASFLARGLWWASAAGVAVTWVLFHRLSASGDAARHLQWPRWHWSRGSAVTAAPAAPRHAAMALLVKEMRLQQLTFVVTALCASGWGVMLYFDHFATSTGGDLATVVTVLSGLSVAVMAGALSIAEERQLGTLEWQVLVPAPMVMQWMLKTAVAIAIALGVGIVLPTVVGYFLPSLDPVGLSTRGLAIFGCALIALTITALYVSSLCTGGLRAVILTLPAIAGAVVFVRVLGEIGRLLTFSPAPRVAPRGHVPLAAGPEVALGAVLLGVLGILVLLLRLSFLNYRTRDHEPARVWKQVALIAGAITLALLLPPIALFVLSIAVN